MRPSTKRICIPLPIVWKMPRNPKPARAGFRRSLKCCQKVKNFTPDGFNSGHIRFKLKGPMKVKRIVANIKAGKLSAAKRFYQGVLGLDILMDHGWLVTYGSSAKMTVQISVASEGGSKQPVPDLSIEVDDVDEAFAKMKKARFKVEYPLTDEPWGVRRFFVRDPLGKLVNILSHQ